MEVWVGGSTIVGGDRKFSFSSLITEDIDWDVSILGVGGRV